MVFREVARIFLNGSYCVPGWFLEWHYIFLLNNILGSS